MKPIWLVLIGAIVLVSGDVFDTATTAIGLLSPIYAGEFVKVGNPFHGLGRQNASRLGGNHGSR